MPSVVEALLVIALSIVNTIRDLFTQQPISNDIWIALAWSLGILIVAYTLART